MDIERPLGIPSQSYFENFTLTLHKPINITQFYKQPCTSFKLVLFNLVLLNFKGSRSENTHLPKTKNENLPSPNKQRFQNQNITLTMSKR